MELVTRKDSRVEMFVRQARRLGEQNAEIVFGHTIFCDLFNEPLVPENQIFHLRPAKPRELRKTDAALFSGTREREAFDALFTMSRQTFPHLIANFRICFDTSSDGDAFPVDYLGQRRASRPIDYFRPHSSRTFYERCLKIGCPGWRGSDQLLQPFYEYCTQSA